MLKTWVLMVVCLCSGFANAETCEGSFGNATTLYENQRHALNVARDAGFDIRVLTKTIGGLVRTVVLAGRTKAQTDLEGLAGLGLKMTFPEIALTRAVDDQAKVLQFPVRPLSLRYGAMFKEATRRMETVVRERMTRDGLSVDEAVRLIESTAFRIQIHRLEPQTDVMAEIKANVIASLRGEAKVRPPPAGHLIYDTEVGFAPSSSFELRQRAYAIARRFKFLTHRVFTYIAGGLIGSGLTAAYLVDPHAAWMAATGAGVLAANLGVAFSLDRMPKDAAELVERNRWVANELDRIFTRDADVSEVLTLTEGERTRGLAEALRAEGFEYVQPNFTFAVRL